MKPQMLAPVCVGVMNGPSQRGGGVDDDDDLFYGSGRLRRKLTLNVDETRHTKPNHADLSLWLALHELILKRSSSWIAPPCHDRLLTRAVDLLSVLFPDFQLTPSISDSTYTTD
jgi:hypothetical protein